MASSQGSKYSIKTRKIRKLRRHADMVARPFKLTPAIVTYALDPLEPLITFTLPPILPAPNQVAREPEQLILTPAYFPPIVPAGAGRAPPSARIPLPF